MNKICVITGATSGIGKEVAIQMARKGYNLAVIGRNQQKGDLLMAELKTEAQEGIFSYYLADMAKINEVKRISAEVAANHPVIDVLINNAGGVFTKFKLTEDGIEETLANNHLGYFISTLLLLKNLKRSEDGRIIIVSSDSHYRGKIDFESFTTNKGYSFMKAYGQSKLANVLFAYYLADKLKDDGMSINALHPGVVKTSIGNKTGNRLFSFIWTVFSSIGGITTKKAAETFIYLATTDQGREHHGKYLTAGKLKESSKSSYDAELQQKFWEWSELVTGVGLPNE